MPAPVPINFAADLGPLAELAMRAGSAARHERQRSLDMSFLRDELDRRQRGHEVEAQFRLKQMEMENLNRAGANSAEAFQMQRASPRPTGETLPLSMSRPSSSSLPVSLSPLQTAAAGSAGLANAQPRTPSARMETSRGVFTLQPDGTIARGDTYGGDMATGGGVPASLGRDRAITGGGFVRAGTTNTADMVSVSVAQQLEVLNRAPNLPPAERALLEQAVRAGGLTTGQLLNSIEERLPGPSDERKIDGLSVRDRQLEIQRLRRRRLSFNVYNDPDGSQRRVVDDAIAAEEESVRRQQTIPYAPQMSGRSLANPSTSPTGPVLTQEMAVRFLQQAGGDPDVARAMAREAGYTIPQ